MAGRLSRCPACGADVHPKEVECPNCGEPIVRRPVLVPVLAGIAGVAVALAAGAAVWVILSPSERPAPPPLAQVAPAPAPAPPPVEAAPAAPPPATPPANVADAPLPLPHVPADMAGPAADETSRRDFARTTQENFVQNGLDMKVTAGGPQGRVITLAFSFPAKTAVELIVSGPFPRQCKLRGFTSIAFSDSAGGAWTYDLATEKLTGK